jgi:threonylcarbamoyladenosine tRNA methylthiotransferase MtaB
VTPRLKTHTLGCKVNQYETEFVRESLIGIGYQDAAPDETADVCIINTCTVTAEGDSKSRQIIRRMHRQNPEARIVVMGCYATRAPQEVMQLPGVAEVVTNKRELPDLLGRFGIVDVPTGISGSAGRHRAWVKVQDGCLLRCSYCIIPYVRPEMHSRKVADILDEVRRLADRGFREVVLTGIHLGHFGVDFNAGLPRREWTRLSTLVEAICRLECGVRVRLSSIEATELTRDLIEVMAAHPEEVCPHLHVCLQSGSDPVLRRMKRRWTSRHIVDRCREFSERFDRPALTTDVIVGFPGETDDDFRQTLSACDTIGFSKIHIFPFSPRHGTPAATMPDQVAAPIKTERCRELAEFDTLLRARYARSLQGTQLNVLLEEIDRDAGLAAGTCCRYLPTKISFRANPAAMPLTTGGIVEAIATGFDGQTVLAVPRETQ